jgi:hypothetical protein
MIAYLTLSPFFGSPRKLGLDSRRDKDVNMHIPLLARGRDRLGTSRKYLILKAISSPLLARGRDRLGTAIDSDR